jgi:hypothetical protein
LKEPLPINRVTGWQSQSTSFRFITSPGRIQMKNLKYPKTKNFRLTSKSKNPQITLQRSTDNCMYRLKPETRRINLQKDANRAWKFRIYHSKNK